MPGMSIPPRSIASSEPPEAAGRVAAPEVGRADASEVPLPSGVADGVSGRGGEAAPGLARAAAATAGAAVEAPASGAEEPVAAGAESDGAAESLAGALASA